MVASLPVPALRHSPLQPKYVGTREYLLVLTELIQCARYQGLVPYRRLATTMGLPAGRGELRGEHLEELLHLLAEVADEEFAHGRPPLGVLAVNGNGQPDLGFFYALRDLYEIDDWDPKQGFSEFWEALREEVYTTWK